MKTNMNKKIIIICFFSIFLTLPFLTLATFNYQPMEQIPFFGAKCDFYDYLNSLYKFGVAAVGLSALVMLVIGGYMYLVSAGNNAMMEKAKGVITDSIIGLVLALASWLILYTIDPNLIQFTKLSGWRACEGVSEIESAEDEETMPSETGDLAAECDKYDNYFKNAAGGDPDFKCLLKAIASAESGCKEKSISNHGACGIMQLKETTANMSCYDLMNNPEASINKAAEYLKQCREEIDKYKNFDIGNEFSQEGGEISYGAYKYATGNDDLIASYNAGPGKNGTGGKKGPFETSTDCTEPVTPAWQCNINPGGFSETQNYVMKVQKYQQQCLSKS